MLDFIYFFPRQVHNLGSHNVIQSMLHRFQSLPTCFTKLSELQNEQHPRFFFLPLAHNSLKKRRRKSAETGLKRSACITFESNGACQHSTDGSDPARMEWLVEENSKGTRWEWVAERSSLLGCENGHLHRGGPAPHFVPCFHHRMADRQTMYSKAKEHWKATRTIC